MDIDRIGKSFQTLTDEYRASINEINIDKDGLVGQLGEANDEYSELIKNNFRQQKKKLEMKNEIETLQNLISNNSQLRDDIDSTNKDLQKIINDKNSSLKNQNRDQEDHLIALQAEYGKSLHLKQFLKPIKIREN